MSTLKPKLIALLGPTASGKTGLAIKLAKKSQGEIVSTDSRQIYKGLNIGTGKIVKKEMRGIPHHLLDVLEPDKKMSVVQYQKLAIRTIKDIQKRGKIPFLVGGTAFYVYSVVEGWQFPKMQKNEKLREKLEKKSAEELFLMLKKLAPERAKNIDRKNKRRLIRAVEIAKTLGKVPALRKKPLFDCLLLGVDVSKDELKKRINKRVDKMFRQDLEKEVRGLVKKYGFTTVLKETIGYAEWLSCGKELNSFPERSLTPFVPLVAKTIKQNTWKFAKRQMTWFKKDKRIKWAKNYQEAERLIKNFIKA